LSFLKSDFIILKDAMRPTRSRKAAHRAVKNFPTVVLTGLRLEGTGGGHVFGSSAAEGEKSYASRRPRSPGSRLARFPRRISAE
jgi:hypothetical protein